MKILKNKITPSVGAHWHGVWQKGRIAMNDKLTLFFGKTNPELSNFYVSPFEIDGTVYNSSEHYFMYQKAKLFDPDGDAIKKMGNDLTPTK